MKKNQFEISRFWLVLICCLVSTTLYANINITITELENGYSNWEITSSDAGFEMDQWNRTGNYGEEIELPKQAFDFDYSESFSISFNNSIGNISNLSSGSSMSLSRITYYQHLDLLCIPGSGIIDHSNGDVFEITDISSSDTDMLFEDLLISNTTVYANSGWRGTVVSFRTEAIPEPTTVTLLAGGAILATLIRRLQV